MVPVSTLRAAARDSFKAATASLRWACRSLDSSTAITSPARTARFFQSGICFICALIFGETSAVSRGKTVPSALTCDAIGCRSAFATRTLTTTEVSSASSLSARERQMSATTTIASTATADTTKSVVRRRRTTTALRSSVAHRPGPPALVSRPTVFTSSTFVTSSPSVNSSTLFTSPTGGTSSAAARSPAARSSARAPPRLVPARSGLSLAASGRAPVEDRDDDVERARKSRVLLQARGPHGVGVEAAVDGVGELRQTVGARYADVVSCGASLGLELREFGAALNHVRRE